MIFLQCCRFFWPGIAQTDETKPDIYYCFHLSDYDTARKIKWNAQLSLWRSSLLATCPVRRGIAWCKLAVNELWAIGDCLTTLLLLDDGCSLCFRWTCSHTAWSCMSCCPAADHAWVSTSCRSLRSFRRGSDQRWAAQRRCSFTVCRRWCRSAGTPNQRRYNTHMSFPKDAFTVKDRASQNCSI